MTEEIRKRLEEAADRYARRVVPMSLSAYEEYVKEAKADFRSGAEHGYKEAIEQVKEWMKTHTPIIHTEEGDYTHSPGFRMIPLSGFLADFEADMNKLWEEKK